MRLGRERPRKATAESGKGAPAHGFNEAGARTPQKVYPAFSRVFTKAPSFNEAGARMPQKAAPAPAAAPVETSFNEAGARTPQKALGRVVGPQPMSELQ